MQDITAPNTLRVVIGCPNSQREGSKIKMGVRAIRVEAIPAAVY